MPDRAAISLRNIGKVFNRGTHALAGVDLDIRQGEFVTLLGPSGCGKSTVLRIIAGLTAPTGGTVEWPGEAATIGFVFQEPTLMPWRTVEANVRLPLTLAGIAENAAVRNTLDRVGLADFSDAYPRELSGGMKMRASIARALVTQPQLLLMDEPFAALDEITRFKLNNDLLDLWQDLRPTVIFVTHSVFESVFLSQRIVVMTPRPGRVFAAIDIPVAYPRGEDFRTSADYAGLCRTVMRALADATARGGDA